MRSSSHPNPHLHLPAEHICQPERLRWSFATKGTAERSRTTFALSKAGQSWWNHHRYGPSALRRCLSEPNVPSPSNSPRQLRRHVPRVPQQPKPTTTSARNVATRLREIEQAVVSCDTKPTGIASTKTTSRIGLAGSLVADSRRVGCGHD